MARGGHLRMGELHLPDSVSAIAVEMPAASSAAMRRERRSPRAGAAGPGAGSLVTNQVRAYDLLRTLGCEGRPTPLGAAFAEYGRIAKTEHLLRVVDPVDDTYRRQMNRELTVQESRHKLARDVCHGKRGTIHQAYRDGVEDQLGALGLVLAPLGEPAVDRGPGRAEHRRQLPPGAA